MMQGIDSDTAATLFIGYHARTGNDDGVLNHTMRGRDIQGVFLNDQPAGELRLNAALAGWLGVPVALIAGDNVLCAEGRDTLGPVEAVEVKEAIDKYTAMSPHPEIAQERSQGRRPARDRQRGRGRGEVRALPRGRAHHPPGGLELNQHRRAVRQPARHEAGHAARGRVHLGRLPRSTCCCGCC